MILDANLVLCDDQNITFASESEVKYSENQIDLQAIGNAYQGLFLYVNYLINAVSTGGNYLHVKLQGSNSSTFASGVVDYAVHATNAAGDGVGTSHKVAVPLEYIGERYVRLAFYGMAGEAAYTSDIDVTAAIVNGIDIGDELNIN